MSGDIVDRLRLLWTEPIDDVALYETINATAAEIVRLRTERDASRAEVERQRATILLLGLADIERLTAEVERLRAAGDALAVRYRKTFGLDGMFDAELRQWEAARRG